MDTIREKAREKHTFLVSELAEELGIEDTSQVRDAMDELVASGEYELYFSINPDDYRYRKVTEDGR